MSRVTATITPGTPAKTETRPRVVPFHGGVSYRLVDDQLQLATGNNPVWRESIYNNHPLVTSGLRIGSVIATLLMNPTEEVEVEPAGEEIVTLTMPRDVAVTLGALAGNVVGGGPVRDHTDRVWAALNDLLDINVHPFANTTVIKGARP